MIRAPYRWLWASMPVFLLIVLLSTQRSVDIQMHDTYFVTSLLQLAIVAALLCGLLGGIYWLARRRQLITSLTVIHVVLSVGALLLFLFLLASNPGVILLNVGGFEPGPFFGAYPWLLGSLIVAVLSQLLLLVNLALSRNP
jgi:heme/copper-type cytochrome/quinol oxidase subunit 1